MFNSIRKKPRKIKRIALITALIMIGSLIANMAASAIPIGHSGLISAMQGGIYHNGTFYPAEHCQLPEGVAEPTLENYQSLPVLNMNEGDTLQVGWSYDRYTSPTQINFSSLASYDFNAFSIGHKTEEERVQQSAHLLSAELIGEDPQADPWYSSEANLFNIYGALNYQNIQENAQTKTFNNGVTIEYITFAFVSTESGVASSSAKSLKTLLGPAEVYADNTIYDDGIIGDDITFILNINEPATVTVKKEWNDDKAGSDADDSEVQITNTKENEAPLYPTVAGTIAKADGQRGPFDFHTAEVINLTLTDEVEITGMTEDYSIWSDVYKDGQLLTSKRTPGSTAGSYNITLTNIREKGQYDIVTSISTGTTRDNIVATHNEDRSIASDRVIVRQSGETGVLRVGKQIVPEPEPEPPTPVTINVPVSQWEGIMMNSVTIGGGGGYDAGEPGSNAQSGESWEDYLTRGSYYAEDKMQETVSYDVIASNGNSPLPDGTQGSAYRFTLNGSAKYWRGWPAASGTLSITFTTAGDYEYTLKTSAESYQPPFWEYNRHEYDPREYKLSVHIENVNGSLVSNYNIIETSSNETINNTTGPIWKHVFGSGGGSWEGSYSYSPSKTTSRKLAKSPQRSEEQTFNFSVRFKNLNPGSTYQYRASNNTETFTADTSGEATIEFQIPDGGEMNVTLPAGARYVVKEKAHNGWKGSFEASEANGNSEYIAQDEGEGEDNRALSTAEETVTGNEDVTFLFKNSEVEKETMGRLTLRKEVVPAEQTNEPSNAENFSFTIAFGNLTPNTTYEYTFGGNTGSFASNTEGKATEPLSLGDADEVTFTLPASATYIITEGAHSGWQGSFELTETGGNNEYIGQAQGEGEPHAALSTAQEVVTEGEDVLVLFENKKSIAPVSLPVTGAKGIMTVIVIGLLVIITSAMLLERRKKN